MKEMSGGSVTEMRDLAADGVLEGPILKEDGMYVKVWNPDGSESADEWKWCPYFCKISQRCKLCTEKEF